MPMSFFDQIQVISLALLYVILFFLVASVKLWDCEQNMEGASDRFLFKRQSYGPGNFLARHEILQGKTVPYWKKGVFQCTMTSNPIRNKSFSLFPLTPSPVSFCRLNCAREVAKSKKKGSIHFSYLSTFTFFTGKVGRGDIAQLKNQENTMLNALELSIRTGTVLSLGLASSQRESPTVTRVPRDVFKRGTFYSCFREN